MIHTFEALFLMKIPGFLPGFDYVEDAMDIYEKHGAPLTNMKLLYFHIAEKNSVSSTKVIQGISELIDFAYMHGERSEVVKYFGLSRRSNGNHLAFLYSRLKEEESARNKNK